MVELTAAWCTAWLPKMNRKFLAENWVSMPLSKPEKYGTMLTHSSARKGRPSAATKYSSTAAKPSPRYLPSRTRLGR